MSSNQPVLIPDELATQEQCKQLLVLLDQKIIGKSDKLANASLDLFLNENKNQNPTIKQLNDLRNGLNDELHSRKVTKIFTATDLSSLEQATIVKWFTKTTGAKNILVSFRVDISLVGGVVIQTPRQRLDYSILSGMPKGRQYLKQLVASR